MAHPLKRYRETQGLSREGMAQKLRCTVGMVAHIENGVRRARPETAMKWEKRTGIPRSVFRPDLWPGDDCVAA